MSNINIQITSEKSYVRIRTVIILTFSLMLLIAVTLTDYYSDTDSSSLSDSTAHDMVSEMNDSISEYHVFESEDGYLGVADKSERVIIEPAWSNISILSGERYIVTTEIGEKKKTGIIDDNSNVVVPFVFDYFKTLNSEYMAGYISEDSFILFDRNGNNVSHKSWTDYEYSDKIMHLKSGNDEYRLKKHDGLYEYIYISLYRTPGSIPMKMTINNSEKIADTGVSNFERIAYITDKYLNYLIAGGTGYDISDITTEQYLSTLSVNDMFRECKISSIGDFETEKINENTSPSYNVKVIVEYDYKTNEINLENITSEITLNIVRDENNRLILKSINKIEL